MGEKESEPVFKVGDIVELISGGPVMTVFDVYYADGSLGVIYVDKKDRIRRDCVSGELVKKHVDYAERIRQGLAQPRLDSFSGGGKGGVRVG